LLVYKLGLVIEAHTADLDVQKDAEAYLNALFALIEIKGK
jgi:hypothetical protein